MRVPDDAPLQQLLDKNSLHELVARYCRGVDRADEEVILSCFHDDAVDDHGPSKGSPAEFARWIIQRMRGWQFVQHRVTNELFEIRGDVAYGETYSSMHATNADGVRIEGLGRYVDRFERRDGEWRIAHRRVITEWVSPGTGLSVGEFIPGRRDRGDPSYER
jgi:ketosteroid isomerase-like protein